MCISVYLKVEKIVGNTAYMHDGRIIRLGTLTHIRPGDYLEVYADIAVGKVDTHEAKAILAARIGGTT